MSVVALEDVHFAYADAPPIIRSLHLEFPEGQASVVVGANGSGKSTLAKLILGLLAPTAGRCVRSPRARMAGATTAVYQDVMASLLPWMSAVGNVALPLRCLGIGKRAAERSATSALGGYLTGDLSTLVTRLSGGQRQVVAWVRAFMTDPRLVVLDEPFAALDVSRISRLSSELVQRVAAGLAAVLIVHDLDQALLVADRVIVLPSTRGGAVTVFSVDLPKPRTPDDIASAADLRRRLLEAIWVK